MTEEEFNAKEAQIINNNFRAKREEVRKTGLVSKLPEEGKTDFGYLVFLRFDDEVKGKVEKFSEMVQMSLNNRAIVYGKQNSHQSLGDYKLTRIDSGNPLPVNDQILYNLAVTVEQARDEFVRDADSKDIPNPWTMFFNYVCNADSVILAPASNRGNYKLIELVSQETAKRGIDFRKTWGRHVTVSRFTSDVPPQEMIRFNQLMGGKDDEASFSNASNDGDIHYAESINVGYFTADRKRGFDLKSYQSFGFD